MATRRVSPTLPSIGQPTPSPPVSTRGQTRTQTQTIDQTIQIRQVRQIRRTLRATIQQDASHSSAAGPAHVMLGAVAHPKNLVRPQSEASANTLVERRTGVP